MTRAGVWAAALMLAAAGAGQAQELALVPYAELQERLAARIDFEDLPRQMSPGVALDEVLRLDGAAFGERFAGQSLGLQGGFDTLAGQPLSPLTLVPGAAGRNLAVVHFVILTNQLSGLGPVGYPARDAGGEGAIGILFALDQFAFGLKVASEPEPDDPGIAKGTMTVTAFRRDGSRIAALVVELDWMRAGYGFIRAGERRDIAGVTITNRDPQGIAIDDVIFDPTRATSLPRLEPCAGFPRGLRAPISVSCSAKSSGG